MFLLAGRSATACSFSLQIMILLAKIRPFPWMKSGHQQQICDDYCTDFTC
ncbi:hypothetical protein Pint_19407 [Pistacia integerrima]|uniref:Uncharacterized protein n=2 Tax=Pistacia TaxID=55512 RepID=A0ACC1BKS6_9ROSI|nr:hypothetical protein Pint_19407 [Pistacia integerrima]KAJ0099645.1 hypothetical protein Patl1_21977 [Pistacia atlantica]